MRTLRNNPQATQANKLAIEVTNTNEALKAPLALAQSQLQAAKAAMGLCNTLSDSAFRTKHKSRVMGNLNRLRAQVKRIQKQLGV